MSKTLLIKTGLLLALAAFAVLAAAAQASTPHNFANGVELPESKGNAAEVEEGAVYGIGWGTLPNKGETCSCRAACHGAGAVAC